MAFASVGTAGTGVSSTSSSSFTLTTGTNTINAADNRFAILTVACDNIGTADGATNEHVSVTGGTGSWTKLAEYTNANAAAAGGATVSAWLFVPSGGNAVGTVFTINLSGAAVDKCASLWAYTKAAGSTVRIDPEASVQANQVDAAAGFGAASFSGLSSHQRLYFRALAKEANSTTNLTVTTAYATITVARSRNATTAMLVRGEWRINASTAETSNPTLAVTGDTAGLFIALDELFAAGVGLAEEADTALVLSAGAVGAPVGLATEADTALALAGGQLRAVGLASEADAALALVAVQLRGVSLASETDTAMLLLAGAAGAAVGLATESDTALALAGVQRRGVGLASESDTALARAAVQVRAVGLASEADASLALVARQLRAVGLATESDTALARVAVQVRGVGLASETDAALARAAVQLRSVGLASESDTALAQAAVQLRAVGLASEADASLPMVAVQRRALGLAVEVNTALARTAPPVILPTSQASRAMRPTMMNIMQ